MSTDKEKTTTNEPEVKEVQTEVPTEQPKEEVKVVQEEKTIGEVLQTEPKSKSEKPESIPFDVFEATNKANRKLNARVKELERQIEDGATQSEVSADIDSIAEEFNVDKSFLSKLERAMKAKLSSEVEERLSSKLKPFEEKELKAKQDEIFNAYYDKAMDNLEDYKGIVNKAVIKTLALQPENAKKTVSQIIEETYGNVLDGRPTIETTTSRGREEPTDVDFDKAKTDSEYFKQIMANPVLKKKYNDGLAQRVLR